MLQAIKHLRIKVRDAAFEALRQGGEEFAESERAHAPVDKNHLRRAIGMTHMAREESPDVYIARVGVRFGNKWFGRSTGWKGRGKLHDPAYYGWLQNVGFWHILAQKRVEVHKGWWRRGFYAGRQRALARMRTVLRSALQNG